MAPPVCLTASLGSAYSPRFSPDGTTLVFLSHQNAVTSGVHNATAILHSLSWADVRAALSGGMAPPHIIISGIIGGKHAGGGGKHPPALAACCMAAACAACMACSCAGNCGKHAGGIIMGGIIIGLLENLAQFVDGEFLHWGNLYVVAPFYALVLMLMLKPYGLFGTRDIERI